MTIVVTPEALELRLPAVEWTMGAYGPARSSELWRRLLFKDIDGPEGVAKHLRRLERALKRRMANRCNKCGDQCRPSTLQDGICEDCRSPFPDPIVY